MAEDKYTEFIKFIKQQRNIDIERIGLTLDDTFDFKCKQCGKCCDYRTDILLMPHDLYNIGRYLGRSLYEISVRYCNSYIGNSSLLSLLRLNTDVVCPFLRHKKCAIDPVKPAKMPFVSPRSCHIARYRLPASLFPPEVTLRQKR